MWQPWQSCPLGVETSTPRAFRRVLRYDWDVEPDRPVARPTTSPPARACLPTLPPTEFSMFQRMTVLAVLSAGVLSLASHTGVAQPEKKTKPEDQAKVKKALQEVQDFIGLWN